MIKHFLFFAITLSFLTSCGQESKITGATPVERLGDGQHFSQNLVIPLSDEDLSSYDSPVAGLFPIVGGIVKFVGDIFTGRTKMGQLQMSYTQPIPVMPTEYLKDVRIKRLFLYIEPKNGPRNRKWYERWISGREAVNFDFLNRVAVRMSTTTINDPQNYVSLLQTNNLDKKDFTPLIDIFNTRELYGDVIDTEKARDVILLKFDAKHRDRYLRDGRYGRMIIIETGKAASLKQYFLAHPKMKSFFKRIHILNKSLLIELVKDPVVSESFDILLSENAEDIDKFEVGFIETCTKKSCYELSVPDVNLIPIAIKGNGLKLDALLNAGKVPESFKLKGFIEFQVKIKTTI